MTSRRCTSELFHRAPIREEIIAVQQRRESIDLVHDIVDRAALARLRVRGAQKLVLGRNHLGARFPRAH